MPSDLTVCSEEVSFVIDSSREISLPLLSENSISDFFLKETKLKYSIILHRLKLK